MSASSPRLVPVSHTPSANASALSVAARSRADSIDKPVSMGDHDDDDEEEEEEEEDDDDDEEEGDVIAFAPSSSVRVSPVASTAPEPDVGGTAPHHPLPSQQSNLPVFSVPVDAPIRSIHLQKAPHSFAGLALPRFSPAIENYDIYETRTVLIMRMCLCVRSVRCIRRNIV